MSEQTLCDRREYLPSTNEPAVSTGTMTSRPAMNSDKRFRILIIAYTDYAFDARVKRHAEALSQHGYVVDVICLASEQKSLNAVQLVGIPMSRYRGHSSLQYLANYTKFFARATVIAARRHSRYKYDVVITCSIPDFAVVSGLIPRLRGARLVLDVHDTMPELYREKFGGTLGALGAAVLRTEERISARMADRVFAVHQPHAERLRKAGIPAEKIVAIVNTPDPRLFAGREKREQTQTGDFVLITHGTLNKRLGLDTALRAVKLLGDKIPRLRYRIIGPGEYRVELQRTSCELNLSRIVRFEDGVPLERLRTALCDASVGLVPNEATPATHLMLPVKLLEYVALGIPVVAPRLRTVKYHFPEDAIGYFDAGNPESLAKAIFELYMHPLRRRAMVERARAASTAIAWDKQRSLLCAEIEQLLRPKLSGAALAVLG